MRIPLSERAVNMGLTSNHIHGLYTYEDQYSTVVYRRLATSGNGEHPTDHLIAPLYSIYTKSPNNDNYRYCGAISNSYQFVGNNVLNQQIRDLINQVGMPILNENPILSYDNTRMRNEIIIQSSQSSPQAGDVYPVIIVNNSYNGTKSASISFGIATQLNNERIIFSFKLGEMRQVHIENANTELTAAISSYMQVFSGNIIDMITNSFNSRLTEREMLGTMDLIEKIGKRKRDEISKLLEEIGDKNDDGTPRLPTAWQMFLAIVRYSSLEPNLNMKSMLENAAESVLVIPTRMFEVLEQL